MDLPTIEEIEKEIEIYGHDEGLTTVDESELEFKNGNHYYKNISLETAKLAKIVGFDNESERCLYFRKIGCFQPHLALAPTQSELQKWLRDKHEIHINIGRSFKCYNVDFIIKYDKEEDNNIVLERDLFTDYNTYEEALEEGLIKALK